MYCLRPLLFTPMAVVRHANSLFSTVRAPARADRQCSPFRCRGAGLVQCADVRFKVRCHAVQKSVGVALNSKFTEGSVIFSKQLKHNSSETLLLYYNRWVWTMDDQLWLYEHWHVTLFGCPMKLGCLIDGSSSSFHSS